MKIESLLLNLPSEIVFQILSDNPIKTIAICRCVCKKLIRLISSPEFVQFHISRSKPGRVAIQYVGNIKRLCKIFDFNDELDPDHRKLCYDPVMKFDLGEFVQPPYPTKIDLKGSINGLLCLRGLVLGDKCDAFCIWNPVTREYIAFLGPDQKINTYCGAVSCGFGLSAISGEYKVVRIFYDCLYDDETGNCVSISEIDVWVYTLGTGKWRSINHGDSLDYDGCDGIFLNGNLHWSVKDTKGDVRISCLDLETELFHPIPSPPDQRDVDSYRMVTVLGDCLCLCDNYCDDYSSGEIVIWVMKEYGVAESWTKEFVICGVPDFVCSSYAPVYPLKVFDDGDILMSWADISQFLYHNKTKTFTMADSDEQYWCREMVPILHVSSFLSLKAFEMENVKSY